MGRLAYLGPEGTFTHQAARDFAGPRAAPPGGLTPWESLAQALLLSNEFAFVD